ncbi:MAG TPA: MBL fold metallo-hydrolase [Rhodocyclaceae bacterium]|nr:MBL fold metallo-hydrolase [Rhodocyclaceae bacterium]
MTNSPARLCEQPTNGTRLILLGTKGGPRVNADGRSNPANLLLINRVPYVIDCGYGVSRQLLHVGVPLNSLRYVFLTHQHSDHNIEYGPMLYNGWVTGLNQQVDVYGPPPLSDMTAAFIQSMKFDLDIRIADEGRPDLRKLINTHEIDHDGGSIFQNDDVKVSALRVEHPPVTGAYAYRFDTADRSIVFSGDTTYVPELATFAKGADVLVHEVMYLLGVDAMVKRIPSTPRLREHLLASHTTTEDVGKIAKASGVGKLVLTHFVPGDEPTITDDMWMEGVRKHYSGQIIVGRDLMEI